jgi:hypothetical protein
MIRRAVLLTVALSTCLLGGAVGAQAGDFGPTETLYQGSEAEDLVDISEAYTRSSDVLGDVLVVPGVRSGALLTYQWASGFSPVGTTGPAGASPRSQFCANNLVQVFAAREGAGRSVVVGVMDDPERAVINDGGDAYTRPDVACAEPGRVVTSFLRADDAGTRVWLFSFDATWTDDDLNDGRDLGPASKDSTPSVAATPDMIHLAWKHGTKLRYKRFTVGDAPEYPVTAKPTVTVDTAAGLGNVRLAADGKRVVLAWERGRDVVARVSTDTGSSWKPRTTLFRGGGPANADAAVTGADVRGRTIIVSGTVWNCFEGCGGTGSIKRTTTAGASWGTVKGSSKSGGYVFGALAGTRAAPSLFLVWDQRFNFIPVIKARYAP